ncbi:transposase [Candidatus Parcubacteria bacterium]|nr:transposase [Candidatus Parcubacteria bacterium]
MSDLYKNKYRIKSRRRDGYDYATDGWYFVTICTKNKFPYFGEIINGKMVLNEIGDIIKSEWLKTGIIRKNVIIDYFVTMPNHFHGIVVIDNNPVVDAPRWGVSEQRSISKQINKTINKDTPQRGAYTMNDTSQRGACTGNKLNPNWKSGVLGSIINQFKGACTKQINKNHQNSEFAWQPRFHDRVIRNEDELNNKRQYIIDNPEKWEFDENNPM